MTNQDFSENITQRGQGNAGNTVVDADTRKLIEAYKVYLASKGTKTWTGDIGGTGTGSFAVILTAP